MTTRTPDSTDDVESEGRDPQPQATTQTQYAWIRPLAAVLAAVALPVAVALSIAILRVPPLVPDSNVPRAIAGIIITALVVLLAISVLAFRPETGNLKALIKTSAAWSVALFLGLAATWWIIAVSDPLSGWHGQLVLDDADVQSYLDETVPDKSDLIQIPTGIFLQSLEFLSGDDADRLRHFGERRIGFGRRDRALRRYDDAFIVTDGLR